MHAALAPALQSRIQSSHVFHGQASQRLCTIGDNDGYLIGELGGSGEHALMALSVAAQAVDIEIQAKEIMFHKANLNRIMAECTGQPVDQARPLLTVSLHPLLRLLCLCTPGLSCPEIVAGVHAPWAHIIRLPLKGKDAGTTQRYTP